MLNLSPSQISALLDKCAYKWYLTRRLKYVELYLIDTSFPGRVVHKLREFALKLRHHEKKFIDPDGEKLIEMVTIWFNSEIKGGYRIKKQMRADFEKKIIKESPSEFNQEDLDKKVCGAVELKILTETISYCKLYLKEIFPKEKPAINEDGSLKVEQWWTLDLPKIGVKLRGILDGNEEGDIISDLKVLAPQSLPAKDPVKEHAWMSKQEQYIFYSMWYKSHHGIIPTNRQYTIKKDKTPVVVELPDITYNRYHYSVVYEKVVAAKKMIEAECFPGNNQSNLCSEDYCGFWMKCKYALRG
jgi:hypothetical protein